MEPLKPEVTGFPSLGVNENHQEEPREIKQEEMSPPRNGAAGEAGAEFARLLAAAAIKVKKERNSDGEEVDEIGAEGAGNFGAVYPRSVVPETRDVGCGRSPQLLEIRDPRQEGQVPQEAVQEPVQPRRQRRGPRILFNPWQVYHLESFFQRNQYPNTFMRQELARVIEVPAARVQGWFKNRRAKLRRQQREQRNMPHMPMAPPVVFNVAGYYRGVFMEQGPVRMPQEPVLRGPPRPPMQPFLPMFLPPPVWFHPPYPPHDFPAGFPNYGFPPCFPPPFLPGGYPPPPFPLLGQLPVAHPGFQPPPLDRH